MAPGENMNHPQQFLLSKFILQANAGNLKTSEYPKEYQDLKMKVSFGQGVLARVPWISYTAPNMTVSNGYYPVFLYYREQGILILSYGLSETTEYGESWPIEISSNKTKIKDFINNPPRYGESYISKAYNVKIEGQNVQFYSEGSEVPEEDINKDLVDLINYYKKVIDIEVKDETSVYSSGLFYMEKQLEDFIVENWSNTEFGKKYDLIYEDGTLVSQQYKTDIGIIDILAKDKNTGSYVVIELKKNQTSDDTVGQIARYMGWIKATKGDIDVRGVIIAGSFDQKLHFARMMLKNIEVFSYEVNFKLKEFN